MIVSVSQYEHLTFVPFLPISLAEQEGHSIVITLFFCADIPSDDIIVSAVSFRVSATNFTPGIA